jgi:hypothetical protein
MLLGVVIAALAAVAVAALVAVGPRGRGIASARSSPSIVAPPTPAPTRAQDPKQAQRESGRGSAESTVRRPAQQKAEGEDGLQNTRSGGAATESRGEGTIMTGVAGSRGERVSSDPARSSLPSDADAVPSASSSAASKKRRRKKKRAKST